MATADGGVAETAMVDGTVPLRDKVTAGKVMAMTFADLVTNNAALRGEVRRSHEALRLRS